MAISEDLIVRVEIETDKTVKSIGKVKDVVKDLDKTLKQLFENSAFSKNITDAELLNKQFKKVNKAIVQQAQNQNYATEKMRLLNKEAKGLAKNFEKSGFSVDATKESIDEVSKALGISSLQARRLLSLLEVASKPEIFGVEE